MSKVPEIRFKGFTADWEQRELGEVFNILDGDRGKNYPNENDFFTSGHTMFLDTGNVKKSGFNFSNTKYISKEKNEMLRNGILEINDFVLTSRGTLGNIAYYNQEIHRKYPSIRINSAMLILRPVLRGNISDIFMLATLRGKVIEEFMVKSHVGSAQPHITKRDFSKLKILLPNTFEEQELVGKYFLKLDQTIILHQCKLKQLQQTKKAFLQKMFPKDGENVPEVRFKGFTDDWEQCELGDIAESFEYGLNAASKEYDGINKYLRITDIDDENRLFKTNNLTSPDIELKGNDHYLLKNNDILLARTGASVGKSYKYDEKDGKVYFAGFLIRARINIDNDVNFIFQNTLTRSYENFVRLTSQRSGQPGINANEYKEYKLYLPQQKEQNEIGLFFNNIDQTITLHQRELELLKQTKQGFLQKMFPKGE